MAKIIERPLTDSDTDWLNAPVNTNYDSVRRSIESTGISLPDITGRRVVLPAALKQPKE